MDRSASTPETWWGKHVDPLTEQNYSQQKMERCSLSQWLVTVFAGMVEGIVGFWEQGHGFKSVRRRFYLRDYKLR